MHKEAIIIIDIFLNTSFKTEVFLKTLESVKKLNLPIMVISNYDVPDILIKQFDYFIFLNVLMGLVLSNSDTFIVSYR